MDVLHKEIRGHAQGTRTGENSAVIPPAQGQTGMVIGKIPVDQGEEILLAGKK
jgi:hypothetical protein